MRLKQWVLALILVGTFFRPSQAFADILHLELGAANYGGISEVPALRFRVLDLTIEMLVQKYGPRGVIYLNDIDLEGLSLAVKHLHQFLKDKGYAEITIVALPGNYTSIPLPHVETLHLSNPGYDQVPHYENDEIANREVSLDLERLASVSETGILITSYFANHMKNVAKYLSPFSTLENLGLSNLIYYTPFGEHHEERFGEMGETISYRLRTARTFPDQEILPSICQRLMSKGKIVLELSVPK